MVVLSLDDFYRDLSNYSPLERQVINYDHPDAVEGSLAGRKLQQLKLRRSVPIPVYDFHTHTRKGWRGVVPQKLLILEGLYPQYFRRVRALLDYIVFADADTMTRLNRRVERDVRDRGRTRDFSEKQFHNVSQPMHLIYVEGGRWRADFIFRSQGARSGQDYLQLRRILKTMIGL